MTRRFRSKLLRLPKQSTLSSRPRPAIGRRKRAFTKPNSRRLPRILVLEAKVKDLQQRLFGKKTEKQSTPASEKDGTEAPSTRKRGQQPGSQGHGRTPRANLPVLAITQDLPESAKCCQRCGLPHQAKPALDETSEVIEVEVSAHVRRYKRTA